MGMNIKKLLFLTSYLLLLTNWGFFPIFFFFVVCLNQKKKNNSANIEKNAKNIGYLFCLGPLIENVQFLVNGGKTALILYSVIRALKRRIIVMHNHMGRLSEYNEK